MAENYGALDVTTDAPWPVVLCSNRMLDDIWQRQLECLDLASKITVCDVRPDHSSFTHPY